jgi:hypothetical protein
MEGDLEEVLIYRRVTLCEKGMERAFDRVYVICRAIILRDWCEEYIEYLTCDFGSVLGQPRRNFGLIINPAAASKMSPSEYAGAFTGVMAG